ncbi:uncharacterized protein LOC105843737 [Hydra vulgaris]|uniref:uncharacterized protein LOC105843737 n=1 Tax=Hydra vulgaris TaxID=6087 RepID=UPI001F5FED02|nr:uncharacterized protein LOC105843737 [Hydra vulgaris]
MESIFQTNIMEYCVANCLFTPKQRGFVYRKYCISNLLETWDIMMEAIHRSHTVDAIYTYSAKTFDKLPHKDLLYKLRAYSIQDVLVDWISAWLRKRSQREVINGITSEWLAVTSGVAQGLGLLLFVIFIIDLHHSGQHHSSYETIC